MKHIFLIVFVAVFLTACGSQKSAVVNKPARTPSLSNGKHPQILVNSYAFLVEKYSDDRSYGYEPENAIKVGGASDGEGPNNERRFLNALAGPNGEELDYQRVGSCCGQKSENSAFGIATLDKYALYYKRSKDTLLLYVNMYDSEELYIPKGFTARKFPD